MSLIIQSSYAQKVPGKIEYPNLPTDSNFSSLSEEDQGPAENPKDIDVENQETDKSSEQTMSNQSSPLEGKPDLITSDKPIWKLALKLEVSVPWIDPGQEVRANAAEAAEINKRLREAEFEFDVYINGKKYNLIHPAYKFPSYSTGSVSKYFYITIQEKTPLSIMTVGYEKDECQDIEFPNDIQQKVLNALSSANPESELRSMQKEMNDQINALCQPGQEKNDQIKYHNIMIIPFSEYSQCVVKSCKNLSYSPEGEIYAYSTWLITTIRASGPPDTNVIEK